MENKKLVLLMALSFLGAANLKASQNNRSIVVSQEDILKKDAVRAKKKYQVETLKRLGELQQVIGHDMADRADRHGKSVLVRRLNKEDFVREMVAKFRQEYPMVPEDAAIKIVTDDFDSRQVGGFLQARTEEQATAAAVRGLANPTLKAYQDYVEAYTEYRRLNCSPIKITGKAAKRSRKKATGKNVGGGVKRGNNTHFPFVSLFRFEDLERVAGLTESRLRLTMSYLENEEEECGELKDLMRVIPRVDADLPVLSYKSKAQHKKSLHLASEKQKVLLAGFLDSFQDLAVRIK